MTKQKDIRLQEWTRQLLARGRYAFTYQEFQEVFPESSAVARKRALNRATRKGTIVSVHQGYYLIIPPAYSSMGMLPPSLFIDGLMTHLERRYYVGLLNAAAWYGAAHQQPQEFFVVIELPALRPTRKKNVRIRYLTKKQFPESLIRQRNTETGTVKFSTPMLTATDLVHYDKQIGGINRAVSVLNELTEQIELNHINRELLTYTPISVLQRLGYVLEQVIGESSLADALYDLITDGALKLYRTPLKTNAPFSGYSADNRWKVAENVNLELD